MLTALKEDSGTGVGLWSTSLINYHNRGGGGRVNSRGITHRFGVVEPAGFKSGVLWSDGGKIEGTVGHIQLNDQVRGHEVKDIHKQLQSQACGKKQKSSLLATF